MNAECTRWARLVDDEAIGETLASADHTFVRTHAAECDACGAESATWHSLASMVDSPSAVPTPKPDAPRAPIPATIELPNTATMEPRPTKTAHPRSRRALTFAALGISVAASIALVAMRGSLGSREAASLPAATLAPAAVTPPITEPNASSRDDVAVSLSLTSGGAVEIDGREAKLGARISKGSVLFARSGGACVVVDPTVRACLEKGSMVRVADTGAHRRLELLRGRIVAELDPQPAGTSFGVTTRDGSAVAIGTAFAVEVPEGNAPVLTRVLHGVVLVRPREGKEQRVGAHQGTTMQSDAPRTSTNDEEERDRTLAAPLSSLTESAAAEAVSFVSHTPGAKAIVDNRVVGVTPLSILLAPGDHAVVVRTPETESRATVHVDPNVAARASLPARTIDVAAVPTTAMTTALPPSRTTPELTTSAQEPSAQEPSAAPAAPRAADLLATARERRSHGDTPGAVAAYKELFSLHANAPEAHAALVPYGEIQLTTSDPHAALGSFERYLTRGGPLSEEASFGKVRALRALGRADEERTSIDAFLRTYPDSTLAPSLRSRAGELARP